MKERNMYIRMEKELLEEGAEWQVTLPSVTDISAQEAICLTVELLEDTLVEMEVVLYPLRIARPEFFPCVKSKVAIAGKGQHQLEIPFEQFDYRQMVGAFLQYVDGISVKLLHGGPILVRELWADTVGDLDVLVKKDSFVGETGDCAIYSMFLINKTDRQRVVNICQSRYGRECLEVEYESYMVLDPFESREYYVRVMLAEDLVAGGVEKSSFLFVPDGDGAKGKKRIFYTSKVKRHPYLLLSEEKWEKRKRAISADTSLFRVFEKEYMEEADSFEVMEPAGGDYVYPSYSQDKLIRTAVAWKITGREEYKEKVLEYLLGLVDERKGYLATQKSYFDFIESREEYKRGDFKVHRAQSAGWVQEAEFFNKVAMVYDLFYYEMDEELRVKLDACLRAYIKFEDWRLTDGDGNNFQIAEAGAGLLCAMMLQDYRWIERFAYGFNGYADLLSSVLLDDGMYFEEATGYVKLAGELFFDIVNAAENFGLPLRDLRVQASFDRHIIHAPWAMRETWADDKKPFLGMSFCRFETFTTLTRSLKDYFDCTAKLLTDRGILFSINDSNEHSMAKLYKKAYYLYEEPLYQRIAEASGTPEILFVPEREEYTLGEPSILLEGAGFGILRSEGSQAVLKFGGHGGYHGHFDRLSLASFIKDHQTFHNNEYTWYGYQSFLFKMWVQTSMAHNMTVVDGRMQKPSPCECIYYEEQENFVAVCAQTRTEWIDPPYGGQTPYPLNFPDEKCRKENRYVLAPDTRRKQGEIGEYSEPVFQRRLLVLFHDYCVVWDYLEGQEEHRYDCLYHPMGRFLNEEKIPFAETGRFLNDPFGAGQFIMNCRTASVEGVVCLRFHGAQTKGEAQTGNSHAILPYMPEASVWRAYPASGNVTVGRYPQKEDSFTIENEMKTAGYQEEPDRKTVSFTVMGKSAGFITLLEAGKDAKQVRDVRCKEFGAVEIEEADGTIWILSADKMAETDAKLSVSCRRK